MGVRIGKKTVGLIVGRENLTPDLNNQDRLLDGLESDIDRLPIGETIGKYFVKVIDYDGTVLKEARLNEGDTFTLPNAPSHDGLVFQEWSCSQEIVDNTITIVDNDIMVGAVYTTASGLNEFDIELTKVTGLDVTLKLNGTKDWGDGTSDDLTAHTYTTYGKYTIKCNGTAMTTSSYNGLFGQGSTKNYYCKNVRLVTVISIGTCAFCNCSSLTNITMPNSVNSIGTGTFSACCSLTNIIIPSSMTSIGTNVFKACYSLTNIIIPNSVDSIGIDAFSTCYSLTNITMPSSMTSIGSGVFSACYSIIEYDFSTHTTVPTLSATSAFTSINSIAKIIVPDALYDEWIAATNWITYADYIYRASEVNV